MKYTINKRLPYANSEVKPRDNKPTEDTSDTLKNTPSEIVKAVRAGNGNRYFSEEEGKKLLRSVKVGSGTLKDLAEEMARIKREHPGAKVSVARVDNNEKLSKMLAEYTRNGGKIEEVDPNSELGRAIIESEDFEVPDDVTEIMKKINSGEPKLIQEAMEAIERVEKEDTDKHGAPVYGQYNHHHRKMTSSLGITDIRAAAILARATELLADMEDVSMSRWVEAIETDPEIPIFREKAFAIFHIDKLLENFMKSGGFAHRALLKKTLQEIKNERAEIKKEKEELKELKNGKS